MKKNFAIFLSPGTFVSEENRVQVESWDVDIAVDMARKIKQRHGAVPYGFYFEEWESGEWEPKCIKSSNMYYLGGTVKTLADIPDTQENRILRSNMVNNHYSRVIENTNSWKVTLPLKKDDVVLEFTK